LRNSDPASIVERKPFRILVINSLDARYGSTYRLRAFSQELKKHGFEIRYVESEENAWQKLGKALRATLFEPYELLLTQKFNPITLAILLASKLRRRPTLVDWDDLDVGLQGNRLKRWIAWLCEAWGPPLADSLTTHSEMILRRCEKKKRPATLVLQGFDEEFFLPSPAHRQKGRERWEIPSEAAVIGHMCTFTHGGTLDLPTILQAWSEVPQPDAFFLLIGGGPLEAKVRGQVKELGLTERVHFTGLLDHDQIPLALSTVDLSVVFMADTEANRARVSFKVLESLALGIPVVGHLVGESKKLFGEFIVEADAQTLPQRMIDLLASPPTVNTDTLRETYTWKRTTTPLLELVEREKKGTGT